MEQPNQSIVLATQIGDRWEFLPSPASIRTNVSVSVFGVVFCLLIAGMPIFSFFSSNDTRGQLVPFWNLVLGCLVSFLYSDFLLSVVAFG
jgi:hypothetical protein